MNTSNGKREETPPLQDRLDAVPDDRLVTCLPTHDAIVLHDGEQELGRIPLNGVIDVWLLDDSSVRRRPTLNRFLFLGPFAFLFPKKTVREAYRLCIQWKDPKGDYQFTYIGIPRRILADHTLNTVRHALAPEVRRDPARKAMQGQDRAAVPKRERPRLPAEASPFITCGKCTVEFRKTDLPPGGRCPVCSQRFRVA